MKRIRRMVSILVILTMMSAMLAGCGKDEAVVTENEETTGQETAGGEDLAENASDNTLSESLKKKYAGTESDKYEYANPIYNVDRNHQFVYQEVGTRYQEEDTYYDDICVYIDSNFINPIVPSIEYDSESQTLTISPAEDDPTLRYGDEEYTDGVKDWGNAPKYWIVQYNDFKTGEALAKPIVTLFTVKAELDAPTVTFDVTDKGYARLSWNAVPGATSYKIYEITESAEFGISLESAYFLDETTETSFTQFPEVDENSGEGVTTQNMDFYDFGITDGEAGLSTVYCVVAVSGDSKSNVSNLIYQKDVRDRLVTSVVYDYDKAKADEADYSVVKETVSELPAFQLVEMADTSIAPMPIDYANASWEENEAGMATGEGNSSIVIHAGIQGTDFKVTMYATETPQSTIDSDIAVLAERQKTVSGKSADVKPQNDIDYVPSADSSSHAQDQSNAANEESDTDDSEELAETEEGSEELAETEETEEDTEEDTEEIAETEETEEGSEELAETEEGSEELAETEETEEIEEGSEEIAETEETEEGSEEIAETEETEEGTEEIAETEEGSEELAETEETEEGTEEIAETEETEEGSEEIAETEETEEGSEELTGEDLGDIEITATSALSEYIATYMLSHEEAIDLSMFPEAGDSDYLVNAIMEAYNQNPLIGSLNRYGYDYDTSTLYLEYEYSKEEQEDMQEKVLAEADKVVGEIISDDMSDVEKEFAINNYLCSTAEYDYDALDNAEANNYEKVDHDFAHSFTPYGVLINKVGVCASYSGAFKVLADKAGLDCYVVTGYLNGNLPHAWNRVSIDGEWATVDSTNNDNEIYANALLNIPDQMSSGLLVEDNSYLLSDALSAMTADKEESEFYRVENRYYSMDELEAELEILLAQGETFTIRTDYTITEDEMREIIQQAMMNVQAPAVNVYMFLGVLTVEM